MASGNTHDEYGKASTALIALLAIANGWPILPIVGGSVAGWALLSPDVDTRSNVTRRWVVLRGIWSPLQSATKHRGITHVPVVGSLVIVGYVAIALLGFYNGLGVALVLWQGTSWRFFPLLSDVAWIFGLWEWFVWAFAGVVIQQILHLVLDASSSWWKGNRKGNRIRKRRNR